MRFSVPKSVRTRLDSVWSRVRKKRDAGCGTNVLFVQIQGARRDLDNTLPKLESRFMAMGNGLDNLGIHCQSMLDQCRQLKELAGGQSSGGGSLVSGIRQLLTGPLEYIDFCLQRQHALIELLSQCEERSREILKTQASMSDILAPLTYMTVLFKIEAATLSDEQRDTFLTVTMEIDHLRSQVEESFGKNIVLLNQTLSTLSHVRSRLVEEQSRHGVRQAEKRRSIHDSFDGLEHQLTQNASRDSQMHQISEALAQEVSKVVIGLQFQDIFKQRCDQVLKDMALVTSTSDLASLANRNLDLTGPSNELNEGIDYVRQGIQRISQTMKLLESNSLVVSDSGETDTSSGFVQVLLDTISEVNSIVEELMASTTKAHEAVKPAGQIAEGLNSTLTDLSIHMQHIALNAQIRSVLLGEGTGLEELAARTAGISTEITVLSASTGKALAALQQMISQMIDTFAEFSKRGTIELERLAHDRAQIEHNLHSLRDHTISTIFTIGSGVDAIHVSIEELLKEIDGMSELQSVIHDAAERVSGVGIPSVPINPTPAEKSPAASATGDVVFDDFGSGADEPKSKPKPAPDSASSGNVELF